MRVLNLYAGIGGNRKLWPDYCQVTAIEYTPEIADVYQRLNPKDKVLVCDAHEYLLHNYQAFDFIWSSPPCQSHTRMIRSGRNRKPRYPDMRLYEEILFLKHNFNGKWVVENVIPYYEPFLSPKICGRHAFWSNFNFEANEIKQPINFINLSTVAGKNKLMDWLGIHYDGNIYYEGNHCPAQVLRNCVHPLLGKQIFDYANLTQGQSLP